MQSEHLLKMICNTTYINNSWNIQSLTIEFILFRIDIKDQILQIQNFKFYNSIMLMCENCKTLTFHYLNLGKQFYKYMLNKQSQNLNT